MLGLAIERPYSTDFPFAIQKSYYPFAGIKVIPERFINHHRIVDKFTLEEVALLFIRCSPAKDLNTIVSPNLSKKGRQLGHSLNIMKRK